jgi:DNA polymerase III gamma/tau subunit
MSLYLKYRPQDFKSIVGQEQVKDILKAEVEQNKINSSYIFF